MKVSIRLQNHGCGNHPYWWIVVAPNRKNIKGRFLEHVGYWAPRPGINVDRQITLNIPRIKYWLGCGAVPTPRIQSFLAIWGIMPKPFYVERQIPPKSEQQMTENEKVKASKRRKKEERDKLSHINYYEQLAKYKSAQTYTWNRHQNKVRQKINAAERQNQILRELLLHHEFIKVNRINELSGNAIMDETQQLLRLEGELKKAKAELALLDKNMKNSSTVEKIHVIKEINKLVDQIREVQLKSQPFRNRNFQITEGENITKEQLDRQLEYELISKKIQKMNRQMEVLQKLYEVVTLEEYANFLKLKNPDFSNQKLLQLAQETFILRGQRNQPPLTKYDLYFDEQIALDPQLVAGIQEQWNSLNPFHAKYQLKHTKKPVSKTTEEEQENANEEGQENEGEQVKVADKKEEKNETWKWKSRRTLTDAVGEQLGVDNLEEEDIFLERIHEQNLLKYIMCRPDVIVPTNRPVHPFPDLETYIPEEYYEPIADLNLKVVNIDSLEPNDELQKYKKKRQYSQTKASKGLKEVPRKMKKAKQGA